MLAESYLLYQSIAALFGDPEWAFPPVPAGAELGKGQRYAVFAIWPEWDPQKRLPPSTNVLRDDLAAIGCDMTTVHTVDRGFVVFVEVNVDGLNVRDVQGVFAEYGGLGFVCFLSDAAKAVPELGWDALEGLQEAVDDLEDTDWAWWTTTVATTALVVALVVGLVLVAIFLWKRSRT